MKKILFIIILYINCILCIAQNTNFRDPFGPKNTSILFYGGLIFYPADETSNTSNSVLCNPRHELFHLNGLQISKAQFIGLDLSRQHLINDSTTIFNQKERKHGYGWYLYEFKQGEDCIEHTTFTMNVELAIFLNGKELSLDIQKEVLTKIKPSEILTIERKSYLFKKGEIYIETSSD